jgi:predicted fused transcriptional regulator/phosphomethylpyrimidine kinase
VLKSEKLTGFSVAIIVMRYKYHSEAQSVINIKYSARRIGDKKNNDTIGSGLR